jgi:hypothetical protein
MTLGPPFGGRTQQENARLDEAEREAERSRVATEAVAAAGEGTTRHEEQPNPRLGMWRRIRRVYRHR